MENISLACTVNNKEIIISLPPTRRLLDILREDLGLVGTKEGCGEGECGACSVLINGKLFNSCLVPAISVMGKDIITIEGLRGTPRYLALEDAFLECGAVQCGFCTPGMIIAAEAFLREKKLALESEVRAALSGNLCRCTGYQSIVQAVLRVALQEGRVE